MNNKGNPCITCGEIKDSSFKNRKKNGEKYAKCDRCEDYRAEKNVDDNKITNNFRYADRYPGSGYAGVYAITNAEGKIVYVGEGKAMCNRIYKHLESKNNGCTKGEVDRTGWWYKILWIGNCPKERLKIELDWEFKLQPLYNKRWRRYVKECKCNMCL